MPDHRFPLQMECLALAVQSTAVEMSTSDVGEDDHTKMILKRATAFLGWAQSTTPTKERPGVKGLWPHPSNQLGNSTEGPAR